MSQSPDASASPSYEFYVAHERARRKLADEALHTNKTALFDALAAARVRTVTVHFDGCGDSGQIEDIEIDSPTPQVGLLDATIECVQPAPDCRDVDRSAMTIRDVIEQLAYDFLGNTHGGWENNEGAFGEFTFDVAARSIQLAFNQRFVQSELSEHTF